MRGSPQSMCYYADAFIPGSSQHHDFMHFYVRFRNGKVTTNPGSSGDFSTNSTILAVHTITVDVVCNIGYQHVQVPSYMAITTCDYKRMKDTYSTTAYTEYSDVHLHRQQTVWTEGVHTSGLWFKYLCDLCCKGAFRSTRGN